MRARKEGLYRNWRNPPVPRRKTSEQGKRRQRRPRPEGGRWVRSSREAPRAGRPHFACFSRARRAENPTSLPAAATNDPPSTSTSDVLAQRPLSPPPLPKKVRSTYPAHRLDWATLLRRTFGIDVLHCDEKVAQKILAHLALPTQAPASSPVHTPLQAAECTGWDDQDGIDPIPRCWQH